MRHTLKTAQKHLHIVSCVCVTCAKIIMPKSNLFDIQIRINVHKNFPKNRKETVPETEPELLEGVIILPMDIETFDVALK